MEAIQFNTKDKIFKQEPAAWIFFFQKMLILARAIEKIYVYHSNIIYCTIFPFLAHCAMKH